MKTVAEQPMASLSSAPEPPQKSQINWFLIGFVAPAVALVAAVSIYPVFNAAITSTFRTRYANRVEFVGLEQYRQLLSDSSIWHAALNSAIYTFGSLVLVIPLALGVALLLNAPLPFKGLVRTIVVLPWILSQTIVALLWMWLVNPDFGPLPFIIDATTGFRPTLLALPRQGMATLIVINVWASYPQATLLLLAAIQTISKDLVEAARMDGASRLDVFRLVTLPLIKPTMLVVMIQLTLLYFNMVTLIYVLTGGGPLGGTETLALKVLKISFEQWNIGSGAALGLIITLINLLVSLVYVRILRGGKDA
ncbi:sugar ABC transporter permease [Martelella sp. HB161492]|uniref:carbohydrate ABC transporter permease n=1 Tax=Martelella sp. HB161492 TaxID=2720726 RepID=UPI0015908B86|nr:sugar ABC transporter permease [Martelella sp. HB161492]